MKCVKCEAELSDGAKFCTSCGTAQTLVCRRCGAKISLSDKFCPNCGGSDFEPPDGTNKIKDVYGC